MAGFNPIIYGRFWVITEVAAGELQQNWPCAVIV
jgi:hypothetical protein